jgi:hypothetical protein
MAGAGYKLFATGDVLTAAQVNTYLMQQTVMVFASSAARTSALSGVLAEGMVSYLQDTNTLEVYDGSAWVGATGDITGLTAGTGISISSATGPVPTVTNSMATEITAKGDLIVGTGSGTFDNLAAGSNGETIVADSSTSTGLRYNPNYMAGKNFVINGGFDIWQRGTSFNTTNGGNAYNADRWTYYGGGTGTITQSTALLRDGAQFALRFTSTSATGNIDLYQLMETSNTVQLQGKTITVSFYVAGTAGKTAQVTLGSSTVDNDGLFGTYTSLTASGTSSLTTTGSYQRITAQFTIPSTARTLRLGLGHSALASTEFISWAQVQLEVGSTATNFSRAGGTIQGELAACQRYYFRYTNSGAYEDFGFGNARSAGAADLIVKAPTTMRTNPTSMDYSNLFLLLSFSASAISAPTASLASGRASANCPIVYVETASGITQNQGYYLTAGTGTSYIGFSSEL